MSGQYVVRLATSADSVHADNIVNLIASLSNEFDLARRTRDWVQSTIEAGHAVVAMAGNQVIGFGCMEPMSSGSGDISSVGYSAIAVERAYHGNGLGSAIIGKLIREGRARYPYCMHFTLTTNAKLARAFERFNFFKASLNTIEATPEFWGDCLNCRSYEKVNCPSSASGELTPGGHRCCCTGLVLSL